MAKNSLYSHPLFENVELGSMTTDERVSLSYQRARLILQTYDLTPSDVLNYSPKFWDLHLDPIIPRDIACFTILAAHINLVIGTLARHLEERADLKPLLASMLRLDTVGIYLLSERGHGLDSFNNETTATQTADGGYILNTPREEAAKFMPASSPLFGLRKVALVMARLVAGKKDCGHRWFIVPICNESRMYPGVVSKRLPTRSGTVPLDFSITSFHSVRLPSSALLSRSFDAPASPFEAWWSEIWRIPLGSMAVAAPVIQALKHIAYIGARYSSHRTIWPILSAIAISKVLEAWYKDMITVVVDRSIDHRVRHGLAIVVKTTVFRNFHRTAEEVVERCGAQGTFESNFMAHVISDCKGGIIAEGDILTLCIRLFSELLLGRYALPLPAPGGSLLARHACSVRDDATALAQSISGGPYSQDFQTLILPQAESSIAAFGHSMAYAAARASGVAQYMLDIYELNVMELDTAWYLEHAGIRKLELLKRRAKAMGEALPRLHQDLDELGVGLHVQAPIVRDDLLKAHIEKLPTYSASTSRDLAHSSVSQPSMSAKL